MTDKLVDHCVCPRLPTRPHPHLTIDSAIVLATFDSANEVTRRFSQTHSQDRQEATEVSSEDTILEESDAGGPSAGREEEAGRRLASPILQRGKTHKRAGKAQERRIPPEFWENVPPRFIPFLIDEGGYKRQAQYVTIHMENDPYALGMTGPNAPIFFLPAIVAPHPTGSTTPCYAQDDLRILQPMYPHRLDINNAMRCTRDDRLMAEVHRYCNARLGVLPDLGGGVPLGHLRRWYCFCLGPLGWLLTATIKG